MSASLRPARPQPREARAVAPLRVVARGDHRRRVDDVTAGEVGAVVGRLVRVALRDLLLARHRGRHGARNWRLDRAQLLHGLL